MNLVTRSAAHTRALARAIGERLRPGDVVVLAGDLGTGKTTFAQGIAAGLGVAGPVTSPTFTIVHEYGGGRVPLVHVDVYRLVNLQELHDLGFEEVLDDERVTLVEWGDVIAQALPREHLVVHLEAGGEENDRVVTVGFHGPRWFARRELIEAMFVSFSETPPDQS